MTKWTGLNKSDVEVSTTNYEFVHGRKPRGSGRWVFEIEGFPQCPATFTGTYTEAKRAAVTQATHLGAQRVSVGS